MDNILPSDKLTVFISQPEYLKELNQIFQTWCLDHFSEEGMTQEIKDKGFIEFNQDIDLDRVSAPSYLDTSRQFWNKIVNSYHCAVHILYNQNYDVFVIDDWAEKNICIVIIWSPTFKIEYREYINGYKFEFGHLKMALNPNNVVTIDRITRTPNEMLVKIPHDQMYLYKNTLQQEFSNYKVICEHDEYEEQFNFRLFPLN